MERWGKSGLALAMILAACGQPAAKKDKSAALVGVVAPVSHVFVNRIDAVGTARANEQVTLASPVTERIVRLAFDDGQFVQRGQVIAVLAQNRQAATLAGAQALERNAKQQLDRLNALKARGFVTNASIDAQVAAAASAQATAAEARAAIGDRIVRAPFAGYVSLRTISAGAVVNQGTPIATISDISRIKLDFTVPETMIATLTPGRRITARSAAYPDRTFEGTIATVDPVIDPNTRAVMVRALLGNPGNELKPGMLLNVAVDGASRTALAVPELSIIGEGDERFVYVVGKDSKAERRSVTPGARDAGLVEIVKGLNARDRVIGEGVVKVAPGVKVRTGPAPGK